MLLRQAVVMVVVVDVPSCSRVGGRSFLKTLVQLNGLPGCFLPLRPIAPAVSCFCAQLCGVLRT